MSVSIYDVPDWVSRTTYAVNDIVSYLDVYYYCKTANSDVSFTASKWGGTINFNSEIKPHFFWTPSYNTNSSSEPRVKSIQFGDGYEQSAPDGINNILLNLEVSFENRKLSEITAILHFLNERRGTESFVFTPRPPYTKAKLFKCRNWSDVDPFYENYSLRVKFMEFPN